MFYSLRKVTAAGVAEEPARCRTAVSRDQALELFSKECRAHLSFDGSGTPKFLFEEHADVHVKEAGSTLPVYILS